MTDRLDALEQKRASVKLRVAAEIQTGALELAAESLAEVAELDRLIDEAKRERP